VGVTQASRADRLFRHAAAHPVKLTGILPFRLMKTGSLPQTCIAPSFRIRLHGAADLCRDGAAPVLLDSKQAAIFAWLAVQGPTPRARLASMLWPYASAERARANLRQRLSTLRLRAGDVIDDKKGLLALDDGAGVEEPPLGSHWLEAFEYDGCTELTEWLEALRESHRAARRQALLAAVRASVLGGALDLALQQADELLGFDRESEEAYRALMEVLYLRGDRAAAIAAWDRCREMLRSLYGVTPSSATQRLGQSILASTTEANAPVPWAALPMTVLRPPRLIGRTGMVSSLVAAWRVGDAVCVSGEGGVGKSRLLGEFAASVGASAIVAARPGDALFPYVSLSRLVLAALERFRPPLTGQSIDWAVRLLPEIASACSRPEPEPIRTDHERRLGIAGLADLLETCVERGCASFVFDDLQFADRASVEALQALLERGARPPSPLPSRLALGSRHDELAPYANALLTSLDSARRVLTIKLSPLAEGEVLELLQSLELPDFDPLVQAPRLRRRVGGNPAFLLESVKLIAALGRLGDSEQDLPVPPGIEAMVERRLELLSPAARHIAELASIAGESFSIDLACQALARSLHELAAPLRELESHQVLYGRQFVHDVVASVVNRNLSAALAERLHRFVAERLTASDGEPAVIAGHWQACGEWRRAGESFLAAAGKTRRGVRPAELVSMLDAAADAFGRCDCQSLRFEALYERLQVSSAPDFLTSRKAQLERLRSLARGEHQSLQVLLATVSADADHLHAGSLETAKRGLARAQALGLAKLAFGLSQSVASQLAGIAKPEEGLAVLEAQRSWVLTQTDIAPRADFHIARSVALAHADRIGEAISEIEQGLVVLRAAEDALPMLPLLGNLGLMRSWRGEFEAARKALVEATVMRNRLHGSGSGLILDVNLGAVMRDLGKYKDALAVLEAALAQYRAQLAIDGEFTDLVLCENHLAQLWLLLGRADLAGAMLASDAASTSARFRLRRATLRLRAARIAGRSHGNSPADLLALLEECDPASPHSILGELELSRAMDPSSALERLSALGAIPVMAERPGLRMHALTLIAKAARATGEASRARAYVQELQDLESRFMPFDMDPMETWRTMQAVLTDTGDLSGSALVGRRISSWLQSIHHAGLPVGTERSYALLHP
jgi:DNA-binding SARP family transcriptional activator